MFLHRGLTHLDKEEGIRLLLVRGKADDEHATVSRQVSSAGDDGADLQGTNKVYRDTLYLMLPHTQWSQLSLSTCTLGMAGTKTLL